jgi:hypothetical protein
MTNTGTENPITEKPITRGRSRSVLVGGEHAERDGDHDRDDDRAQREHSVGSIRSPISSATVFL